MTSAVIRTLPSASPQLASRPRSISRPGASRRPSSAGAPGRSRSDSAEAHPQRPPTRRAGAAADPRHPQCRTTVHSRFQTEPGMHIDGHAGTPRFDAASATADACQPCGGSRPLSLRLLTDTRATSTPCSTEHQGDRWSCRTPHTPRARAQPALSSPPRARSRPPHGDGGEPRPDGLRPRHQRCASHFEIASRARLSDLGEWDVVVLSINDISI